LFSGAIVLVFLFNLLQPDSLLNWGVKFILFILILLFSIFLVRGVYKEIEDKEKIEKLARDLERVNQDLANANERLKELDKLKSEFLSLATHQIRAPLTSIKGYASLVLEGDYGKVPEPIKNVVQTIFNSCQNLVVIVSEFLDISRIEQGRMKYDLVEFDINKEIKEIITELKPTIEKSGLSVGFKSANTSNNVYADMGKIKQVIGNILDNSIKYTPHGSITVSVYDVANKIKVAVSDTGIGIAAEDITRLFSKFTRAKDAFRTNVIGTGLGLYVAKQMIEAQNGKIWVESHGLGKGSTFFIELPKSK
jgi:signal transduction histidine kinase